MINNNENGERVYIIKCMTRMEAEICMSRNQIALILKRSTEETNIGKYSTLDPRHSMLPLENQMKIDTVLAFCLDTKKHAARALGFTGSQEKAESYLNKMLSLYIKF
jgi:hypothetical protein